MEDCVLWTHARSASGYGRVWDPKAKKIRYTHEVVWESYFGFIEPGSIVTHKCGNRNCVSPVHLFLAWDPKPGEVASVVRRLAARQKHLEATTRLVRLGWQTGAAVADLAAAAGVGECNIRGMLGGLRRDHVG